MAQSIQTKRDEMLEQASAIGKDLQEVSDATRRMANDGMAVLRDAANQYLDEGKTRVSEMSNTVQQRVQEQPLKSVLIATAVGFLLGVFFRRR